MGQDHVKSIAWTIGSIAATIAVISWLMPWPSQVTAWTLTCRFVAPCAAVGLLAVTYWTYRRKDLAPDYLRQMFGRKRFDCNGLGIAIEMTEIDGVGWLEVYYQNRYERACRAKITVRRLHGFAFTPNRLTLATVVIHAAGAEFGVCRVPVDVPRRWRGRRKPAELSAGVTYPKGRGRLLRFHPGRRVGSPVEQAGLALLSPFLGLLGPVLATNITGRLRIRYPRTITATIDAEQAIVAMAHTETLWTPGDDVTDLVAKNAAEQANLAAA